jgi:hypothetical protein
MIKYPLHDYDEESILYEIAIGTVLNRLRKHIPNFRYTYGGFYCGIPFNPENCKKNQREKMIEKLSKLMDNINLKLSNYSHFIDYVLDNEITEITKKGIIEFLSKDVQDFLNFKKDNVVKHLFFNISSNQTLQETIFDKVIEYKTQYNQIASDFDKNLFCSDMNVRSMMLSEFIPNSNTLEKVYNQLTRDEIFNIYCQIAFSLNMAWREFEFCHNDFHNKNILIRNLDEEITIKYSVLVTGGRIINVPIRTKKLAIIIDYSYSKIKFQGRFYAQRMDRVYDNNTDLEQLFFEQTNKDDNLSAFTDIGNDDKLKDDQFSPRLYEQLVKLCLEINRELR